MQGDVVKPHTVEDEIDSYWPSKHLIKYYEDMIASLEERIARYKVKIEEAKKD